MGEREDINSSSEIFITSVGERAQQKLGNIIADSISWSAEEDMELDSINDRRTIRFSCAVDLPNPDMQQVADILGIGTDGLPKVCSLTISGEPYIHRLKGLKYPNKKRATRIWKKWAKRFGITHPNALFLPDVEIGCDMGENSMFCKVTAKA